MSANLADLRILLSDYHHMGTRVASLLHAEGPGGTKDVLEMLHIKLEKSYELLNEEVKIHERAYRQAWLDDQDIQP